MRLPTIHAARGKLLALFLLLAGLPLAALGWLGWQLLQQDRALETQRRRERLENSANLLADTLARVSATSPGTQLPRGTVWLLFDERGVIRRVGAALPYYPAVVHQEEAPARLFDAAEAAEFQQANPAKAAEHYRALAASKDRPVRAAALMRLARALRNQGKTQEALAAYSDLAGMGATPVADAPAELVGRRESVALLENSGDTRGAAIEREALANVLSEGRYALDRATYDFYHKDLPEHRSNDAELASTAEEWWPRWHAEPSGRAAWVSGDAAFATVWAPSAEGTVAMMGVSTAGETGAIEAFVYRRNLLITGFGLMALVTGVAAYFIFGAFHREWTVARLQSEFVAQVSHEFRTPLTAMRHLTELLEEGGTPAERLPQYYQALGRETRRLHGMVENLLDFGRMESGQRAYQMEDTNLVEVAQRVMEEFASPRLRLDVSVGAPPVRADGDALALAVRNLVDNAIKYSPASSDVNISVEARDGRAGIAVSDSGAGISPEEQREVLRKFVRGSAAKTLNVKGTGIGLAMVDQVAKAHGGRLDVESELGRGSRFTLWVPLAEQHS
jgi:two-component system phosphate regulon sensor histidine kinase PhoR